MTALSRRYAANLMNRLSRRCGRRGRQCRWSRASRMRLATTRAELNLGSGGHHWAEAQRVRGAWQAALAALEGARCGLGRYEEHLAAVSKDAANSLTPGV